VKTLHFDCFIEVRRWVEERKLELRAPLMAGRITWSLWCCKIWSEWLRRKLFLDLEMSSGAIDIPENGFLLIFSPTLQKCPTNQSKILPPGMKKLQFHVENPRLKL
jgi:hypothetical protein